MEKPQVQFCAGGAMKRTSLPPHGHLLLKRMSLGMALLGRVDQLGVRSADLAGNVRLCFCFPRQADNWRLATRAKVTN